MKRLLPEGLKRPIRSQLHRLRAWRKRALLQVKRANRGALIRQHFNSHSLIKVSLGAGKHAKPGWLNTDYEPFGHPDVVYLDAAEPFPFSDASVDYFYTEHMIEHLPLSSAQLMLRECYRTLKVGGKIRIATPDMMQLAKLLFPNDGAAEIAGYAEWALRTFPPDVGASMELTNCMVFNNFMRNWGHQFVYDERTLLALLKDVGFAAVRRCAVNFSEDPQLVGQEMHQQIVDTIANNFETMVLEATK